MEQRNEPKQEGLEQEKRRWWSADLSAEMKTPVPMPFCEGK
jgi:hypothetical protein